jgi:DNA-binding MarR family transcriptional regulator
MTARVAPIPGPDAAAPADGRREAVRQLESAFSLLFTQLRRAYAQAAQAVSPGMLPGTFKVLTVIDHIGPVSASTLAERMEQDKGLISRAVTELEGLGLIERTPDPADGRIRLITLSPFGHERYDAVRFPFVDRLESAMDEWPLASIERLTGLLEALASGVTPAE